MAVLTLPGAAAVLAAQAGSLPQPDQLCGPFSLHAALHAVLEPPDVPSIVDLARASGTKVWPHDVEAWRPAGAPTDRTGWDRLPRASAPDRSGTDAVGLAEGAARATGGAVAVVPVSGRGAGAGSVGALLARLAEGSEAVGVVANVRTGLLDPDRGWDVGHFVVPWAVDLVGAEGPRVAVADTYPQLGAAGEPPGSRWVSLDRLGAALAASPGRGLLLVVRADLAPPIRDLVSGLGLDPTLWAT